jgi:hypothetical protein
MMIMSKEAMKQALDFLRSGHFVYPTKIATDLEEALAKQEQGEPVAWKLESGQAVWFERTDPEAASALPPDVTMTPLYTTPQQRTWVGLTDEEYSIFAEQFTGADGLDEVDYGKAIEAKLKEKNT